MPADFLSGAWHQEVGCLLNQAEVNMPSEEKGGNIPQMEWGVHDVNAQQTRKQGYRHEVGPKTQIHVKAKRNKMNQ